MALRSIKVGLYGDNGHQLREHPGAEFVHGPALDDLLEDSAVELVSLCSPRRAEQARDAIRALEAGKHVYAEKPSALTEADLEGIIAAAGRTERIFHEQAATAFEAPYHAMRGVVQSGVLGEVIQIYAQKSYPWHDDRPQDEEVDGGLGTQAAVYCTRFVEHVAGVKIKTMMMRESTLGNPVPGGRCRRAISLLMELENGGLASGVANYLCPAPPAWPKWGYEILRIWGANGFVECVDGGPTGTLVLDGAKPASLDLSERGSSFFGMFLEEIRTGNRIIPFTIEEELGPTRWVIRAKAECGTPNGLPP